MAKNEVSDLTLATVWQGHVFLDDRQDRGLDVDRAANRLAEDLPGRPAALSEGYAIFQESHSKQPRYSVHRVG